MVNIDLNKLAELKRAGIPVSSASIGGFISLLAGQNLVPIDVEVSFDDPEDAEKPFAPHYEQYIRPHIQRFEEKRIEALQILRKRTLIAILIIVVCIAAVIANAYADIVAAKFLIFLVFGTAMMLSMWCYLPTKKYKSAIKEKIFPNIFNFFGEDFQYSEKAQLSIESLKPSGIIPSYDKDHTEDYIKGSYKDVVLELIEAKLSSSSGTGKDRRTTVHFKGIVILLSMNKNFSGKTIVQRDAGKFSNWVIDKIGKMKKVALEDPVFEKKFEVYSSDQVEARYLLTTSFMERLLELSTLFGNLGLECSFYDDKLLLMIPSPKNHFETSSIFQSATFTEDVNTSLKEMLMIFQIIDILKLHQRTGL
jgi:hypothetical protein